MEHNTNAAPNRPSHGDPDQANLEAYGDWVTVAPEPAPQTASAPVTDAADNGVAQQEPESRAAQELTEAEEQLLDQLAESERVAAAPGAATAGPGAATAGPGAATAVPAAATAVPGAATAAPVVATAAPAAATAAPAAATAAPAVATAAPAAATAAPAAAMAVPGAGTAAPAAATAAPAAGDPHATGAALAKLERQLSSLNADLKAVGQQLADLRDRGGAVPGPAAAPAAAAPPAAQAFAAEAGEDPLAITLEELEHDAGPPREAAVSTPPVAAGDAAELTYETQAHAPPPGGQETPVTDEAAGGIQLVAEPEPEPEPLAAAPVETLPAEDPIPEAPAPAPAGGAELGGQVREEVRSVLAYLDQLLDALPPEKVREFAQSKHFATYKKLFREFGLDD